MLDWMEANEYQNLVQLEHLLACFAMVYPQLSDLLGVKSSLGMMLNDPPSEGGEVISAKDSRGPQVKVTFGEAQEAGHSAAGEGELVVVLGMKGNAQEAHGVGDGVIKVPPKIYCPPLPSLYKEPELGTDLNDSMEWMFKDFGHAMKQDIGELPPRDDVLEFDFSTNAEELESHLNLKGCPQHLQEKVQEVVVDYWDVFCERGLRRPI